MVSPHFARLFLLDLDFRLSSSLKKMQQQGGYTYYFPGVPQLAVMVNINDGEHQRRQKTDKQGRGRIPVRVLWCTRLSLHAGLSKHDRCGDFRVFEGIMSDLFVQQPHPEATLLADTCAVLREEFLSLAAERDRLLTTDIPAMTAEYQLKIGATRYALFCRECELRRLKRKVELIQAAFNRMESVSLAGIDARAESL